MSPLLIITAAVCCGYWVRRLGCYMNSRTNPRKVSVCYMINLTNSTKVDDKSDDNYKNLDDEFPSSPNHEDRFTELPYEVDDKSDDSYKNLDDEFPWSPNHEDLFTELPDEILSYILTHLTLRDIVRMTTLSKRWKDILSLLPNLDLEWTVMSGHKGLIHEDACDLYRKAYVTRVNKILQECRNQDISSFNICFCFTKEYVSHVDHWVSFASKKRLQRLALKFVCTDSYGSIWKLQHQKRLMPEVMYTITNSYLSQFPSLKDLCLSACILKVHNNFGFNKLVRLDLFHVVLEGDQLQWILSNSSTVEWLRIRMCNLPKKLCFGDSLQRLRCLIVADLSELQEIELNAKNLKSFEYVGSKVIKLSFLSAAELEFSNVGLLGENYKAAECIFRDMATSLPSLETLLLEGKYSLIHLFPTHQSTLFRSVVSLSLFIGEDPESDMGKSFPYLLNSFPLLQKLYLKVPPPLPPFRGYPRTYELPDVCHHTSLKEIELGHFKMDWIPCANYFLKSAVVLDRMLITCNAKFYSRDGKWERSGPSFSQVECEYIRFALQGNAISPNADLVIF